MIKKTVLQVLTGVLIVVVLTLVADAWTPPASTPPNLNVSQPLNISGTTQTKTGKLNFPWFEDYDQPGYYVDPGGNSWLYRLYSYDVRSDIFYDRNNTGYYNDPDSVSRLNSVVPDSITLGGVQRSTWPIDGTSCDWSGEVLINRMRDCNYGDIIIYATCSGGRITNLRVNYASGPYDCAGGDSE